MRRKSYLLIFPFLLLLTGCADISGKHPVISQTTVTNIQTQQYTFSIVQSKGSSAQINDKISYTGAFELIVKNDKGIETSHKSLNDYFSKQKLVFEGPVNLDASNDYNADNLFDIPIGFPAGDGSGQYQYGIFSIDKDGKIFFLAGQRIQR